jgi:hypothetical protein
MANDAQWAKAIAERGAVVMHTTGVVGKVTNWQATFGEVQCAVVEVGPGHVLLADPDNFRELSSADAKYLALVEHVVGETMRACAQLARAMQVTVPTGADILICMLARAHQQLQQMKYQAERPVG